MVSCAENFFPCSRMNYEMIEGHGIRAKVYVSDGYLYLNVQIIKKKLCKYVRKKE